MFVAITKEPLVEPAPVLVPAEIAEPRQQLETRDRERDVVVGGVAIREHVAQHELRLRRRLLADELQAFLSRERLRQVLVDGLHRVVVLGAEERHVRQHEQQVDRRRSGFGGEHVLIADANERLLREG